jgi:hypothetical protein
MRTVHYSTDARHESWMTVTCNDAVTQVTESVSWRIMMINLLVMITGLMHVR